MASKTPTALFWVDLEGDGLPQDPVDGVLDYNSLHLMEIAVIVTDMDLKPVAGYREAMKMTKEMAAALRANDVVREMHRKSGLIKACLESTKTVSEIEDEIIALLDEEVPGILFYIAGSGVAAYDQPLIKAFMPKIAERLHYAPYDIGILRRTAKTMTGQDIVNVPRSYQDGVKTHRAWDDVEAHLEEGHRYQEFFRRAVQLGAHNG